MLRLFNKSFFKFAFGFVGMLSFGLLGIIVTGYVDSEDRPKGVIVEDVEKTSDTDQQKGSLTP